MEASHKNLPPNPRQKSNFLSIIFFAWTVPLFKKGYGKVLQLEDLFRPLSGDNSSSLGERLEE